MKKSGKNKKQNRKSKTTPPQSTAETIDVAKRKSFRAMRNGAIGLVVLGGAGAYFYSAYQSDKRERDLTRIGRGKPTVVQIHDPNCQLCTALQKQARKAVSNFDEDELNFLVANITTAKGREFANKHNVPHVTLLLFDKRGKLQNVLQGVRQEEELTNTFSGLVNAR